MDNKFQSIDPIEFPTLLKYDSHKIEEAIQKLMKQHHMTRQQCLVNLEMDLSEAEQLSGGTSTTITDKATNNEGVNTQNKLFPDDDNDYPTTKVVDIVMSSRRPLPAQFTSDNGKSQSFCVDFDIYWEDEYEMANIVWKEATQAYGVATEINPMIDGFVSVIKIGEDIMLGAYILTKLGEQSKIGVLVMKLLLRNNDWVAKSTAVQTPSVQEFFKVCWKFGIHLAQKEPGDPKPIQNKVVFFTDNPNLKYR